MSNRAEREPRYLVLASNNIWPWSCSYFVGHS